MIMHTTNLLWLVSFDVKLHSSAFTRCPADISHVRSYVEEKMEYINWDERGVAGCSLQNGVGFNVEHLIPLSDPNHPITTTFNAALI